MNNATMLKCYLEYSQSVPNKNRHNAAVIVSYVTVMKDEINFSDYYTRDIIELFYKIKFNMIES